MAVSHSLLKVRKLSKSDKKERTGAKAASSKGKAEAEHREILKRALLSESGVSLKKMLQTIPNIGDDSDFNRPRTYARRVKL